MHVYIQIMYVLLFTVACVLMDVIYQQGEEIQPNCSTRCICQNREFVCETVPCVADGATCTVSGYSHYQTFDLRFFDVQGDCEYILTTPCDSDEFIITVQNGAHNQYVSGLYQINITLPSESISVILGRSDTIFINGAVQPICDVGVVLSTTAIQVLRVGGNTHVILTAQNLEIFWDGLNRVEVTVNTAWQNRLCGLCGNYNDDDSDDFITSNSEQVDSVVEFVTSWVTGNASNCGLLHSAPYCLGTTRDDSKNTCSLLKRSIFTDCNALIDPSPFLTNCKFDYCNCHTNRRDCFCESLAAYASACSRVGIVLSTWREHFCRKC